MKEAYAVRRTVPPSAELEAQIDQLLAVGVGEDPRAALSQLAKLGARLIIQRAVEEEFDAWLGRARYERRPDAADGMRPEGGRAGRLGVHRRRRTRAVVGDVGDARVLDTRAGGALGADRLPDLAVAAGGRMVGGASCR